MASQTSSLLLVILALHSTTDSSTLTCDYNKFNRNQGDRHPMTYPKSTCEVVYSGVTEEDIQIIVDTHNQLRNKVAGGGETNGDEGPQPRATNMREMGWNDELATVAQAWANQCVWAHNTNNAICTRSYKVNSNIYIKWSSSPRSSWREAVLQWYNDVHHYPGNWVGKFWQITGPSGKGFQHYTQLVWATTYEIGCGAIYKSEEKDGWTYPMSRYYFCNYGPAGNVFRRPVYQTSGGYCPNGPSAKYQNLCK